MARSPERASSRSVGRPRPSRGFSRRASATSTVRSTCCSRSSPSTSSTSPRSRSVGVTDEFISYLRGLDTDEELDQASEFLVVAATLLDLKVAGLLPQGELVDAEDVALLEARDLLFARLLQYRAFKEASQWFAERLDAESTRHVRSVRLEEKYRQQTPELVWTLIADDFAALAALALAPREIPTVGLDHLHAPLVSASASRRRTSSRCCAAASR